LYGRIIDESNLPSGTSTIQINVSKWASGLYAAVSSYKGSISGKGKFIVY